MHTVVRCYTKTAKSKLSGSVYMGLQRQFYSDVPQQPLAGNRLPIIAFIYRRPSVAQGGVDERARKPVCHGLCRSNREKELGLAAHFCTQAHPHQDRSTLGRANCRLLRQQLSSQPKKGISRFRATPAGERPHCSARGTYKGYSCARG